MGQKDDMIHDLQNVIRDSIKEWFDSKDRFDNRFILNSSVVKGSTFEKNEFVSNLHVVLPSDSTLMEVVIGDRDEIEFEGSAKVASSLQIPKKGPELNSWSQAIFSFQGTANVTYDSMSKRIIISDLNLR